MDPKATLQMIIEACVENDITDAHVGCDNLLGWYAHGGFSAGETNEQISAIRAFHNTPTPICFDILRDVVGGVS